MAKLFLLAINFQKLGAIKGAPTKGRDPKWLDVFRCEIGAVPQGAPTGGKPHSPRGVVITREVDAASPQLLQALNTNDTITSAIIEQRESSPNGLSRLTGRITLTNGAIRSIRPYLDSDQGRSRRVEELKLSGETVREERF